MTNPNDDPEYRRQRARLAGLATAIRHPDRAYTEAGLKAAGDRFYQQTDPSLPEAERERQAAKLRRTYMRSISTRGVMARRLKRLESGATIVPDQEQEVFETIEQYPDWSDTQIAKRFGLTPRIVREARRRGAAVQEVGASGTATGDQGASDGHPRA